ncbi:hypothetical protein VBH21_14195 [Enterococcus hirae]|uniref:hypothetical protein n=1 Tax=Enterococcus TaxID=1350 RepID=UPI0015C448AB|nr:hypothetical protein [Enterococcus hirae]EHA3993845.1 hypothetical protein [Enterococcus faecalis]EMF0136956.1 hypothetical protein [Enterococcus hirae]EMF0511460.1 hypothetical protein [Enterococcus hirae]
MSNYEEKEAKILLIIVEVLSKMDLKLEELDTLNEDDKYDEKELWNVLLKK